MGLHRPRNLVGTGSQVQEGRRMNHLSTCPSPDGGVNRDLTRASFKAVSFPRRKVLTKYRRMGVAKRETLICRISVYWKSTLGPSLIMGLAPFVLPLPSWPHSYTLRSIPFPWGTRRGLVLRGDQQHSPNRC